MSNKTESDATRIEQLSARQNEEWQALKKVTGTWTDRLLLVGLPAFFVLDSIPRFNPNGRAQQGTLSHAFFSVAIVVWVSVFTWVSVGHVTRAFIRWQNTANELQREAARLLREAADEARALEAALPKERQRS